MITRTFKWDYAGKEWTWELQIPQALYDFFKELPRSPTQNYSVYVTHPLSEAYISKLAAGLTRNVEQEGYNSFQAVSFTAAFVQSLPYTVDKVTTGYDEYPRYPIETLVDSGGDCEDTTILMLSLLDSMEYGAVVLTFSATATAGGHLAAGVKGGEGIYGSYYEYNGAKYYFLETTGNDWELGDIPDEYADSKASIYPLVPVPILTDSWTTSNNGFFLSVKVTVTNLGSAPAKDIYVNASFDAGNDKVWNRQESLLFDLDVDQAKIVTLYPRIPLGKHTRLLVQIVDDGYAVSTSYSTWFDS